VIKKIKADKNKTKTGDHGFARMDAVLKVKTD